MRRIFQKNHKIFLAFALSVLLVFSTLSSTNMYVQGQGTNSTSSNSRYNSTSNSTSAATGSTNSTSNNPPTQTNSTLSEPFFVESSFGPVGNWTLNEGSGTTAADSSGNGNNGTLVNGPTWLSSASCERGASCLGFDGSNDRIDVPSSSSLNIRGPLTVTAWINLIDIPPSGEQQNIYNFPAAVAKGPTNTQYLIFVNGVAGSASGTSPLVFRINTGIDNPTSSTQLVLHEVASTNKVVFGQWIHVAGVYDGSTMKIYFNGVLDASTPVSGSIAFDTRPLTMGAGANDLYTDIVPSAFVNQLHGSIDEAQVYDRALNATEIRTLSNTPPVANAGADQIVNANAAVTLDGRGSSDPEGDPITYSWSQTAGPSVTLNNPTTAQPTFTAPSVANNTVLTFSLVVNDGHINSQPDTVNVTIVNHLPFANAGPAQTVANGAFVTLDGSASHDPDGSTLTYAWTQISGPSVTLSNPNIVRPTFYSPCVASNSVLTFRLVVNDGFYSSAASTVNITVSVVGSSSDPRLDSSGEQRVTYFDGTNIWSFYYDPSTSSIMYRYSANNGATWSTPTSSGTGALIPSSYFAVFGESNKIMISYVSTISSKTAVRVKDGTINIGGGTITWTSTAKVVLTVTQTDAGKLFYPSFEKIGTKYFLAFNVVNIGKNSGYIYSATSIGGSWASSVTLYTTLAKNQPGIVGIAKVATTKGVAVFANYTGNRFNYKTYDGNAWSGSTFLYGSGPLLLTANSNKTSSFSITSDGTHAWVAYVPSNNGGSLKVIRFSDFGGSISVDQGTVIRSGTFFQPTITSQSGNIGIFFVPSGVNANITTVTAINGSALSWHMSVPLVGIHFNQGQFPHVEKSSSLTSIPVSWRECSGTFNVKTLTTDVRDTDSDGLYDSWESNGIDYDRDGIYDFVPANASPLHKDAFLEIDYMQYHDPMYSAVTDVINAFANAPLSNPDSVNGIALHITVNDQIPHVDSINSADVWNYFYSTKGSYFGTSSERASSNSANILAAKKLVYYYSLWLHTVSDPLGNILGQAESIPGNDFYVALGGISDPAAYNSTLNHVVGTKDEQEGSLMHEFGHDLGLFHGGGDQPNTNCKPNYLSVMNYAFVYAQNAVPNRPLDYSRSAISSLDEGNLSEPAGVGQSVPPGLTTAYGKDNPAALFTAPVGQAIDWNKDSDSTDTGLAQNINNILGNILPNGCYNLDTPREVLTGFNDWSAVTLQWREGISYYNNIIDVKGVSHVPDLTDNMVTEFHLAKLRGIDYMIQTTPQKAFKNNEESIKVKKNLHEMLVGSDQSAEAFVKNHQTDKVVSILNHVRMKLDSSVGGDALDDEITEAGAQQRILMQLDNDIAAFKLTIPQ